VRELLPSSTAVLMCVVLRKGGYLRGLYSIDYPGCA